MHRGLAVKHNRGGLHLDVYRCSVEPDEFFFNQRRTRAQLTYLPYARQHGVTVVRMHTVKHAPANHVAWRCRPEHCRRGRVDIHHQTIAMHRNRLWGPFKQAAIAVFAFLQRGLRKLALSDVLDDAEGLQRNAIGRIFKFG